MKKILYVITKSNWGGAQRYVYDLATNLPKDQFETVVAAGRPDFSRGEPRLKEADGNGPLFARLNDAGVRTISIRGLERDINPLKELQSLWNLFKIFCNERPDIIHLNSSKIGGLGAIAAKLSSLITRHSSLVVFTVHGWGFHEDRNPLARFIIFTASWLSSLFQDTIILIDRMDYTAAKKFIPHHKLVYIPNGIAKIPLPPARSARSFLSEKIRHHISPDTMIIGTIAELTKNKGLTHLIDAVNQMKLPITNYYRGRRGRARET